jgi:16S rRNA (guanine527-N7)-methyltransferase
MLDQVLAFLTDQRICFTRSQRDKMRQYAVLLEAYAGRMNLISSNDFPHLAERHYLPSLWLCHLLQDFNQGNILDIGSGGGFPGVLIQIMLPESQVVLLDAVRKKAGFLEEVCDRLALPARVVCMRAEEYVHKSSGRFDVVVARAVAVLDRLWRWSHPLLKPAGYLLAMKGGEDKEEFIWLKKCGLSHQKLQPPAAWLSWSSYLRTKYIIKIQI